MNEIKENITDFLLNTIEKGDILIHIGNTKKYNKPNIFISTGSFTKSGMIRAFELDNNKFRLTNLETYNVLKITKEQVINLVENKNGICFCHVPYQPVLKQFLDLIEETKNS